MEISTRPLALASVKSSWSTTNFTFFSCCSESDSSEWVLSTLLDSERVWFFDHVLTNSPYLFYLFTCDLLYLLYDIFIHIVHSVFLFPGRAIANRMCAPKLPNGNINSDVGLQTALYVAHETGHK